MNTRTIQRRLIQKLGALEERLFDRLCYGTLLVRPILMALLLMRLGHALVDYVSVSEQILIIEEALAATRREFAQGSASQINQSEVQREIDPLRGGGVSDAAPLEVINRIALAQGIDLDEALSGVRCSSNEPLSPRQIQIMFRASFSQLREFNHRLNDKDSTLVTESLLIERNISLESSATITARICISVVTKTS
jgi:hypothetical protein